MAVREDLDFSFHALPECEFGAWIEEDEGPRAYEILVTPNIRDFLGEMLEATLSAMGDFEDGPKDYSPSEDYKGKKYLTTIAGEYDTEIRQIHDADNLFPDQDCLSNLNNILGYFARFRDGEGKRLTAIRGAQYFKAIAKRKCVTLFGDTLSEVTTPIFKLDRDFDMVLDSGQTHILRPGSFESLGGLKERILAAVSENVEYIRQKIPFVDFTDIETFAEKKISAARLLASIKKQKLENIDKDLFIECCEENEVEIQEENGTVCPSDKQEIKFLKILDRRLFTVKLIPNELERFTAASRTRV